MTNSNNNNNNNNNNRNVTYTLLVNYLPIILPCPRSLTWLKIKTNTMCEDETTLRYVPYFGDEDTTGFDVSAYDCVPGEFDPEICS